MSALLVEAFYNQESAIAQHHCRREELRKLEECIQDISNQHRLLVAAMSNSNNNNNNGDNEEIIGFVHLDNRPPPPNAYLKQYVDIFVLYGCSDFPAQPASLTTPLALSTFHII